MNYKKFGNTGEKISVLGFGCMRFPEYEEDGKWFVKQDLVDEMIKEAVLGGVNYFDSAYYYCHENSELALGKAIKPYRKDVLLSTKCPMGDVKKPEDYQRLLNESLKRLDTDYIDFYHFWAINKQIFDEKIIGLGLLEEALKAKKEGKIRHISFSFHDAPDNIKYIIDTAKIMETMLIQYNLLDRSCEEMIDYAASQGLGVVAMGPVGGGRLALPSDFSQKLVGSNLPTYELALKFVINNPNICCALSGMQTLDVVKKNLLVTSGDNKITETEWEQISSSIDKLNKFNELYCTGCAYCQPCPQKIKIPQIFSMYTHLNVYGLTEVAKKEFADYSHPQWGGKLSDECINCGFCEKKCPQHLKIRDLLKEVEAKLKAL